MKTHNAIIYHCMSCGRVVHAEIEGAPPQCCGHAMTKACAETVHDGDNVEKMENCQSETLPAVKKRINKPK